MKKRILGVVAATLGSPLVLIAWYAVTHPTVAAIATSPIARVSDRDAKTNLCLVDTKQVLLRLTSLPA